VRQGGSGSGGAGDDYGRIKRALVLMARTYARVDKPGAYLMHRLRCCTKAVAVRTAPNASAGWHAFNENGVKGRLTVRKRLSANGPRERCLRCDATR
jgi:hypothetical protein